MFIIWDRMFGTFIPETEEAVYGLIHPLQTYNPIVVQYHHLGHVVQSAVQAKSVPGALQAIFYAPAYDNQSGTRIEYPEIVHPIKKYDPHMSNGAKLWALAQFLAVTYPIVFVLGFSHHLPLLQKLPMVLLIASSLWEISLALDGKLDSIVYADAVRMLAFVVFYPSRIVALIAVASFVFTTLTFGFSKPIVAQKVQKNKEE